MLFNEPKLLKLRGASGSQPNSASFSALQRAEIAEMLACVQKLVILAGFSALQRAEIAEISLSYTGLATGICFSALQRAEIAEMQPQQRRPSAARCVSVLFSEPKIPQCSFPM